MNILRVHFSNIVYKSAIVWHEAYMENEKTDFSRCCVFFVSQTFPDSQQHQATQKCTENVVLAFSVLFRESSGWVFFFLFQRNTERQLIDLNLYISENV